MPTISMFYGIVIYINSNDHPPPHFHARYGDYRAAYGLNGDLLVGTMPKRQERLIMAWAELHHDELAADWALAMEHAELYKIEPLK